MTCHGRLARRGRTKTSLSTGPWHPGQWLPPGQCFLIGSAVNVNGGNIVFWTLHDIQYKGGDFFLDSWCRSRAWNFACLLPKGRGFPSCALLPSIWTMSVGWGKVHKHIHCVCTPRSVWVMTTFPALQNDQNLCCPCLFIPRVRSLASSEMQRVPGASPWYD